MAAIDIKSEEFQTELKKTEKFVNKYMRVRLGA